VNGKPFIVELADLGGGLNEGEADTIADREASEMENLYPVNKTSLWQREGRIAIANAYSETINSIARYNPSFTEEEFTILGCAASVARLVGRVVTPLSVADGRVYPSLSARWWFRQYNDELFACQKGNGGVKRIFGDSILEAGIEAPTLQPQALDGGAGQKTAGEYWVGYTYYNSLTGAESNLSPVSKSTTIIPDHQILIQSIGLSPSLQVNARRIYVTLPDDEGTFYLVGQINDNVTTTFIDNALPPDDYGAAFDGANGLPPSQAHALETGKERLYVTDGKGVYWSETAKFQSFKATSYYPVSRDDGYEVVGLLWWEDKGLVLLKQNLAMLLRGSTPSDWEVVRLSSEHGSPAGQSAAVADGILYYYTGTNFVRSGGGLVEIIPNVDNVRSTIDAIPDSYKGDVQAEVLPSRKWVMWTVQTDSGRKIITYDYGEGVWLPLVDAPYAIKRLVKSDQSEVLLSSWFGENILREYLTGTTDDGAAIPCRWRSKAFGDGTARTIQVVSLATPRINGSITVRIINDQNGTTLGSRTISLNTIDRWKRVRLPAAGYIGYMQQLELVYSGTAQLRLSQIRVKGTQLPRRAGVIL